MSIDTYRYGETYSVGLIGFDGESLTQTALLLKGQVVQQILGQWVTTHTRISSTDEGNSAKRDRDETRKTLLPVVTIPLQDKDTGRAIPDAWRHIPAARIAEIVVRPGEHAVLEPMFARA